MKVDNISFEKKIRSIDWVKYLAPEYYDPNKMDFDPDKLAEVLIELGQINESSCNNGFLNEVRYAIGNDHRGTYYPAALEAIDLIIEIEKNSDNENARRVANCILNDLYYFQLEMGGNEGTGNNQSLYEAINDSIKEKLKPYSDEEFEKLLKGI